jgi:hypothetical protein
VIRARLWAALLLFAAPASALAQEGSIRILLVAEETGAPLANAQAVLDGSVHALADAGGVLAFPALPPGRHQVEVSYPGRVSQVVPLEVAAGRETSLRVALARRPVELPGIRVEAEKKYVPPRIREFERRRAGGNGHFITSGDIERQKPHHTTDLFRMVPGVEVVWTPQGAYKLRMRGSTPILSGRPGPGSAAPDCQVLYFIDGMMHPLPHYADEPILIDRIISPVDIEAIEVYRNSAQVPGQYRRRGAECGVVLIWTRNRAGERGRR